MWYLGTSRCLEINTKKEKLDGEEWIKKVIKGEKDAYVRYGTSLRKRKNIEWIYKFKKWL